MKKHFFSERRTITEKGFNEMELMISNTVQSDSGVYQCVAVNEVGEIWAAGRLQVIISRNNPDAPTNLKCHALSSKKILISWEPPKYLPTTNITAYTVHYSPVGKIFPRSIYLFNNTKFSGRKALQGRNY